MFKMKLYCFLGVVITMFLFAGCSISVESNNVEMYSREDVKLICTSTSFGKGRNDDIYVALDYIYSNELIEDQHGSDFQITATDLICHTSVGQSYFFSGFYKGEAEYSVIIDNVTYRIVLSKKIFSNWNVNACYIEE